jgi:hypothetical protein
MPSNDAQLRLDLHHGEFLRGATAVPIAVDNDGLGAAAHVQQRDMVAEQFGPDDGRLALDVGELGAGLVGGSIER